MRSSSPRLLRLAWLLTGGASSAEDLVQETLERVYVAWPRIDAGGTHNYARRVLLNLHTDSHRRTWRESVTDELPEGSQPDRSEQVVLADHLTTALAELPLRERQCVILRHHSDLSERDVADLLNISTGTVKSSTSRGLAPALPPRARRRPSCLTCVPPIHCSSCWPLPRRRRCRSTRVPCMPVGAAAYAAAPCAAPPEVSGLSPPQQP